MKISQKQIEAVISLPGPTRYEHFIKVVADQGCAWALYSAGWALAGTDDDKLVFPLWPAREYAELCASGRWSGYTAKKIDLDEIFEGLLPSLQERKTHIGIFYTPSDKGVLPTTDEFENDLRDELSKIE